jgi:hypothetical protein
MDAQERMNTALQDSSQGALHRHQQLAAAL